MLRKRLHSSWLIAVISISLVVGVWLTSKIDSSIFLNIGWLVGGLALAAIALWRRSLYLLIFCVLGGLMIGLWRGSIDRVDLAYVESHIGSITDVEGRIREDLDILSDGQYVLRIDELKLAGKAVAGSVWVTIKDGDKIQRSDHVAVSGKLSSGFGSFVGSMFRAEVLSVNRPVPGDVALVVRDWFAGLVRSVVLEPQASLGLGFLLGQRRALPTDLAEALQIVGLTHIIVASGYNLTILVRFCRRFFMRVSRFAALIAGGGMVAGFIAITGASPSMSRAGLVAGLSLLAWYYGRRFHPVVLLGFAAAVTVVVNPSYAWGDMGWQLSFAAFAGVMILAPLLQAYFFGDKKPSFMRQIIGETASAQIATLPILVVGFGYISNVSLLANTLVLPLVPMAMLLVFVTGVAQAIWPWLAAIVALPATWLLSYMIGVANIFAELPWARSNVDLGVWFVAVYYLALVTLCVYLKKTTKLQLRKVNIAE